MNLILIINFNAHDLKIKNDPWFINKQEAKEWRFLLLVCEFILILNIL